MGDKQANDQYSEEETVGRADNALKRMLSTPHKPIGKKKKRNAP
jgi:hypothetical protein